MALAARRGGVLTLVGGDRPVVVPWSELHDRARRLAGVLADHGVGPGRQVAVLGPTSAGLVTAVQATWWAGAAAVVLPLPMRLGHLEEFAAQTRARIAHAEATVVVVDRALLEFLDPRPDDPPLLVLDDLLAAAALPDRRPAPAPAHDPDGLAVLQFTSGSTSAPKGVELPHRCVTANLDAMTGGAGIVDGDVFVSWLPLYHDMGLIGFLTLPMTTGIDLVLAAPQDFLAAPARWVRWLSEHRGTVTAGPNFAYALAARALRRADDLDLSALRIALSGAEAVDPETTRAFCEAGARHGLDHRAVFPAFGMAEATLAVTFPPPGRGLRVDRVDRHALEHDGLARPVRPDDTTSDAEGYEMVLLGRPLPGFELRVCDPATGAVLGEREVGELEIRGPSVSPGYFRRPEATEATRHDGWLRSGDLAYLADGELVICGRIKDVVIVGGRNVFPEDVERAAARVEGVRPGNVIAFGHRGRRGREALVVVAEVRHDDPSVVRAEVARRVTDSVGVPPEHVVTVAPGSLPKTSSGKLQRARCRELWLADELPVLEG